MIIMYVGSVADVECVKTVSGICMYPESVDSIDISYQISSDSANGVPGYSSLTVNHFIANFHGFLVITSALISSFILIDHIVNKAHSVIIHSRADIASSDEGVVISSGRSVELEEEVRPVRVDPADTTEGGNQVFASDPDKPAEPDRVGLDDHEEVLPGSTIVCIYLLLDVLGVGFKIILVEATGGVGEVDEGSDLSTSDSSTAEFVKLEGLFGGGELGGRRFSDAQ
jgi:hypothetical protein